MKRISFLQLLITALALAACAAPPAVALAADGSQVILDKAFYQTLKAENSEKLVPMERALDALGYQVVAEVTLTTKDGQVVNIPWNPQNVTTTWDGQNTVMVSGKNYPFAQLSVRQDERLNLVEFTTEQVANALLGALDLPMLEAAARGLDFPKADQVVLLFIDGLGFLDLQQSIQLELVPNMAALAPAKMGLSTYPSITRVFTASLLTGLPPAQNGVTYKGRRQTQSKTILEIMQENNLTTILVEGNTLYFNNLNDGDLRLTPDSDNDGYTDEETCRAGLSALAQNPDFLWVHLHGVDDAGHDSGRFTPQVQERITFSDNCVGQVWNMLPSGSLLVIISDHGMHSAAGSERAGEHGTLMAEDRYNFLITALKP